MLEEIKAIRRNCMRHMLRPIVRFCLDGSQTLQDFIDIAKLVFVEVGTEEMKKSTRKINVSRLSVMTGVHRKDVTNIYKVKQEPIRQAPSLITRVISVWEQDRKFTNSMGKPRVLTVKGENAEFRKLVETISTHINPGTVQFEMERAGLIKISSKGATLIKVVRTFQKDPEQGFNILARDVETMIQAIEENILKPKEPRNLHIRTEYDNVSKADLPKIRAWILQQGKRFHKRARDYISKFDVDINADSKKQGGAKVVVQAVSFTLEQAAIAPLSDKE